ncbi:hypothetical protein D3C72_623130 [compost metagenome]
MVDLHRLAVAISSYNARADKYYRSVLNWAVHSPSPANFFQRISRNDFSHRDQRAFVDTTRKILDGLAGQPLDDATAWRFLRSFQILHFDFDVGNASRDAEGAIDRLRHALEPDARDQATTVWSHLVDKTGELTPVGGGASRPTLAQSLTEAGLPSPGAGRLWRDLEIIDQESRWGLASIKSDIHGLRLNRTEPYEQVQEALSVARFVQIDGEPGSGKSALLRQLAEETAAGGPILVLKDSRVQPRGWGAHGGQLGLKGDLVALLSELGTTAEGHHTFYPASPYQQPFLGLLRQNEAEGLRLVRAICNHSVDVWRWLRQRPDGRHEAVTPLPVEVEFPWGLQTFWGDGQVYTWFRGSWGNHASQSALMALELWAFERIEAGEDFPAVMQKVLEGNDCVAALGLAVSLCLAHPGKSIEAALPLITCPQIWHWDLGRSVSDQSSMSSNEIGDWIRYRHMLEAVRDLNRRPHRAAFIGPVFPGFQASNVSKTFARLISP